MGDERWDGIRGPRAPCPVEAGYLDRLKQWGPEKKGEWSFQSQVDRQDRNQRVTPGRGAGGVHIWLRLQLSSNGQERIWSRTTGCWGGLLAPWQTRSWSPVVPWKSLRPFWPCPNSARHHLQLAQHLPPDQRRLTGRHGGRNTDSAA